jgi:hypothetical protein
VLHGYSVTRFSFFILLSVAVVAAWLFAYRRYLMGRSAEDAGYIAWLLPLAHKLMLVGGVLAVASGALWLATLPEKMAWFATSAWVVGECHRAAGDGIFPVACSAINSTSRCGVMRRLHSVRWR